LPGDREVRSVRRDALPEPKVAHPWRAFHEHHVPRLEIAVQHATLVGMGDGVKDRAEDRERLIPVAGQAVGQR
jgi:hypothetical protein